MQVVVCIEEHLPYHRVICAFYIRSVQLHFYISYISVMLQRNNETDVCLEQRGLQQNCGAHFACSWQISDLWVTVNALKVCRSSYELFGIIWANKVTHFVCLWTEHVKIEVSGYDDIVTDLVKCLIDVLFQESPVSIVRVRWSIYPPTNILSWLMWSSIHKASRLFISKSVRSVTRIPLHT